ncbi:U11/U12 small nuclear ribonucleoprotein [Batrachochytrium dendrobatidis]
MNIKMDIKMEIKMSEISDRITSMYNDIISDHRFNGEIQPETSLDDLRTLLASKQNKSWHLTLDRGHLQPLDLVVRPIQCVRDLKRIVRAAWTRQQMVSSNLVRQRCINWRGIWTTHRLALTTDSSLLDQSTAGSRILKILSRDLDKLKDCGVSDGSHLRFVRVRRVKKKLGLDKSARHDLKRNSMGNARQQVYSTISAMPPPWRITTAGSANAHVQGTPFRVQSNQPMLGIYQYGNLPPYSHPYNAYMGSYPPPIPRMYYPPPPK